MTYKIVIAAAFSTILVLSALLYNAEKTISCTPCDPDAQNAVIASVSKITSLKNGKWIRCFRSADGVIYLKKFLKSMDGGKTFEEQRTIDVEEINAAPERAVLAKNGLFYALAGSAEIVRQGVYQVDAWRSVDELKTLRQEKAEIQVPGGPGKIKSSEAWNGLFIYRTILEMPDGSWLMSMYGNFENDRIRPKDRNSQQEVLYMMRSFVVRSTDRGHTWRYLSSVAVPGPEDPVGEGFVEPAITLLDDGRLLCVMRTGHHYPLYASWSSDGGKNWTPPLYTGLDRGCDPCLLQLQDGRVALSWGRRFPEGWSKLDATGDAVRFSWPGATLLNLALSSDGGATWVNHRIAQKVGSGYSTFIEVEPSVLFFQVDQWVGRITLNPQEVKTKHERFSDQ